MPRTTWTLTDVESDVHLDRFELTPADVGAPAELACSVRRRTLRGGLRDGVDAVELAAGPLRATVLPQRGMGIWRAACGDVELGWRSPVRGPVHPRHVPLDAPDGLGWLRGFDEWLCRCGLESNGAPQWSDAGRLEYPLHGRIANLPAHHVEVLADSATGEIAVTGTVDESRLFGSKLRLTSTVRLLPRQPTIEVLDQVTNLSSEPADFELLYHVNFGAPLLRPGAQLIAPVGQLAPRDPHSASDVATWDTYAAGQRGLAEFVHYFKLAAADDGRTAVVLKSAADRAVALRFNTRELPCFTLWKCQQPESDGYVTGLEPGTNYPNVRSHEEAQGRVVRLAPGESRQFQLAFTIVADAAGVAHLEQEIAHLAAQSTPRIFHQPQPGWSPVA